MDSDARNTLFRQEVLEHRRERLHGSVCIRNPVTWQIIACAILGSLVTCGTFLFVASYAKVEHVTGEIVPDKGVVPISPSRPGTISELLVDEGAIVRKGDVLARLRSEEDLAHGDTAPARVIASLGVQSDLVGVQQSSVGNAAAAELSRLTVIGQGLAGEIDRIGEQIELQQRLVSISETQFARISGLASRQLVSDLDRQNAETELLTRKQYLSQLQQGRATKQAELGTTRRSMRHEQETRAMQLASLSSSREQIEQQLAQAQAARGYAITAPVPGVVTAISARVGQAASSAAPLMLIVPSGVHLLAHLEVPGSAMALLRPGQEVRLEVDAFPFQKFGVVSGRIASVARAAVLRPLPDGRQRLVFPVAVEIPRPSILAYGSEQPLLPGMAVTARIVVRRQTLFEWLFEPLYSVARR